MVCSFVPRRRRFVWFVPVCSCGLCGCACVCVGVCLCVSVSLSVSWCVRCVCVCRVVCGCVLVWGCGSVRGCPGVCRTTPVSKGRVWCFVRLVLVHGFLFTLMSVDNGSIVLGLVGSLLLFLPVFQTATPAGLIDPS